MRDRFKILGLFVALASFTSATCWAESFMMWKDDSSTLLVSFERGHKNSDSARLLSAMGAPLGPDMAPEQKESPEAFLQEYTSANGKLLFRCMAPSGAEAEVGSCIAEIRFFRSLDEQEQGYNYKLDLPENKNNSSLSSLFDRQDDSQSFSFQSDDGKVCIECLSSGNCSLWLANQAGQSCKSLMDAASPKTDDEKLVSL